MDEMEEIRLRLGRADENGARAWTEATGLARRLINTRGRGIADGEALKLIADHLENVRIALNGLKEVEELLSRAVTGAERRHVQIYREQSPCVVCEKTDALVSVQVCARCSGFGPFTTTRSPP